MISRACALAHTHHSIQFMHTPNVKAYVGQINARCLASWNSCVMHVFEEATNEGSDEHAHWHSLTRSHTLRINKVWKYNNNYYVGQTKTRSLASSDSFVRHVFKDATID